MSLHRQNLLSIDRLIPRQSSSAIIERFRQRSLVRTCLYGAWLSPLFLMYPSLDQPVRDALLQASLLILCPIFILFFYHYTGWQRLASLAILTYQWGAVSWAMVVSQTCFAPYWFWYVYCIVYAHFLLGVRLGAFFSLLTGAATLFVLEYTYQFGFNLGRFAHWEDLVLAISSNLIGPLVLMNILLSAYDRVRSKAEVKAVMVKYSDEESARLARIGANIGPFADHLQQEIQAIAAKLPRIEQLSKRVDTPLSEYRKSLAEINHHIHSIHLISGTMQETMNVAQQQTVARDLEKKDLGQSA